MHIFIGTVGHWIARDNLCPIRFFKSLSGILLPNDILAIGSYKTSNPAKDWLKNRSLPQTEEPRPYDTSYHLNFDEYPDGKSWEVEANQENFHDLSELCAFYKQNNIPLFFDDIVAFRKCGFFVPLLDYHNAFRGGHMILSGFFQQDVIENFGKLLGVNFDWIYNE